MERLRLEFTRWINLIFSLVLHGLSSCILSPDVKHKNRGNKQQAHDKNWNWAHFESWWVFSIESPHSTAACCCTTSCCCTTTSSFPLFHLCSSGSRGDRLGARFTGPNWRRRCWLNHCDPSYNDLQSSTSKRAKNYALLKLLLSLTKTIFTKNFRFLKVGFTCDQISARSPSQGTMRQKRSTLLTICW